MKKKSFPLTRAELSGHILGLLGAILPFILPLAGLTFAGKIALSMFLVAASYYMLQPVPIYATSLAVILVAIFFLSKEGPVYKGTKTETTSPIQVSEGWQVPATAIHGNDRLFIQEDGHWKTLKVTIQSKSGDQVLVPAKAFTGTELVSTNAYSKNAGYTPGSYKNYFGTLANPIIILFLGGFMLARGAVKYNLDSNLSKFLLRPFGKNPKFIILGLMLVTALLSAFMSNTATTAMMMTVIIPILAMVAKEDRVRVAVALSIPIAANIGGMATPIGTPPNAIVIAALAQQKINIAFTQWIILALPVTIIMLSFAWWMLIMMFPSKTKTIELKLSGSFDTSPKAWIMYATFAATVLLWITEKQHGISSSMVAFVPVAVLSITSVLDVEDIRTLPWEVLWLVAGGIALGIALDQTGLAAWMVNSIDWASMSAVLLIIVFVIVGLMMSNFLSNTVTATLLMPLGISIGLSESIAPGYNMVITAIVIGLSTSMAMLLPISTPPNAIAISTGLVETKDMAKTGAAIGIFGAIVIVLMSIFYWPLIIN